MRPGRALPEVSRHGEDDPKQVRVRHEPYGPEECGWIVDLLHEKFQARRNYRGGPYTVGYWTMTNHAGFGVLMGAFPSGRVKGKPFASGITPVEGLAPELPSCLRFVGSLDQTQHMVNGQALNLKFTPPPAVTRARRQSSSTVLLPTWMPISRIARDSRCSATSSAGRSSGKRTTTRPNARRPLCARVGLHCLLQGLNPHMQREIILRAEYDITSGQEVWDGWKDGAYEPVSHAATSAKPRLRITPQSRAGVDLIMKWLWTPQLKQS